MADGVGIGVGVMDGVGVGVGVIGTKPALVVGVAVAGVGTIWVAVTLGVAEGVAARVIVGVAGSVTSAIALGVAASVVSFARQAAVKTGQRTINSQIDQRLIGKSDLYRRIWKMLHQCASDRASAQIVMGGFFWQAFTKYQFCGGCARVS